MQQMPNSTNLAKFYQFDIGIVIVSLIIGTLPQRIIAAEVNLDTLKGKENESPELVTGFHSVDSNDLVNVVSLQNLEFELNESIPTNQSIDNDIVVDVTSPQNLEFRGIKSVTPNINSENEHNSISVNNNHQKSDTSYKAADLQLNTPPLVEGTLEEQLLAREVGLDTLCRLFPLNSRCANYQPPSQRQRQEQPAQPAVERQLSGYAVTGKVSTLGIGIEGTAAISPNFNGRLGFNYFDLGFDTEESDIEYNADLQLLSVSALIDWFPSRRSGFHLTGGLLYNNNQVDATARSTETLEIGGVEFPLAAVGQLEGEATFPNTISPYVGIGYGNPVRQGQKFGFSINLGVVFAGSPEVNLNATGPIAGAVLDVPVIGSLLEDAIEEEEEELEDDLSGLGIYPVLSIGVSYQF